MKKPDLTPVTITLAGKERRLRFTMKAVLALNEELDRNVLGEGGLFDDDKNIDLKAVAAAVAHGLQEDEKGITTDTVLEMVDVRELSNLAEKLAEAFGATKDDETHPPSPGAD